MSEGGEKNAAKTRGKPFKKGNSGRPKGVPNKTTTALKEAILEAGRLAGSEMSPEGDGLVSYLKDVAENDQKAFCGLLGRVLPLTVAGDKDDPVEIVVRWQE